MDWQRWGKYRAVQTVRYRARPENLVCLPALVPRLPFAWVSDATKVACSVELKRRGVRSDPDVFEGTHENTFEKLRVNQLKYELPIVFGHDEQPTGSPFPTFMEDYRTRGTPWFTVIDAGGSIVFSDFHLDAERLVKQLEQG